MSLSFYVADTETNGLSLEKHNIVQISIVRVSDRVQLTRDIICDNPELSSPEALKVTNKTIKDIQRGMDKKDAVELFTSFLQEDGLTNQHRVLVCHNVSFDKKFLLKMWESVKTQFPVDLYLCTLEMMKEYAKLKGLGKIKKNLKASMELLKVGHVDRFHNAQSDVQNGFMVWEKLMQEDIDYLSLIKNAPHIIEGVNDQSIIDEVDDMSELF